MDLFAKLKGAIKLRPVTIDNEIFQLHYRATFLMLVASSLLVASKQHFGNPINCISNDDLGRVLNTYCWVQSTFTVPEACNDMVGVDGVPHPCIDKYLPSKSGKRHTRYYQWVYFVLLVQAVLFYAPHMYWKFAEGQLQSRLAEHIGNPVEKKEKREEGVEAVVTYFERRRGTHRKYFSNYIYCELYNFFILVLQMKLVDDFLGGFFAQYGSDVLKYFWSDYQDRVDPMEEMFPRLTKCTFHKYGSSGDIQKHDSLCLLPLNIINEKIYITMWFWFVFLAILNACWLVYRALTCISHPYRLATIARKAPLCSTQELDKILCFFRKDPSDWFVLNLLASNIDSSMFKEVVDKLLKQIPERVHTKSGSHGGRNVASLKGNDIKDTELDNQDGRNTPLIQIVTPTEEISD